MTEKDNIFKVHLMRNWQQKECSVEQESLISNWCDDLHP